MKFMEYFAKNHPAPQEIVQKHMNTYLEAWGDPKNTPEDNKFLQEEALKAALNDPAMLEAYNKAMTEFKRIQALKNMAARTDISDTVVTTEGIVTERKDVLSGEKEQI
jgi:hypothetical protein